MVCHATVPLLVSNLNKSVSIFLVLNAYLIFKTAMVKQYYLALSLLLLDADQVFPLNDLLGHLIRVFVTSIMVELWLKEKHIFLST